MSVLNVFLIPFLCFAASLLINLAVSAAMRRKIPLYKDRHAAAEQLLRTAEEFFTIFMAEWFVMLILRLLTRRFMIHDQNLLPTAVLAGVSLLPYLAVTAVLWAEGTSLCSFIRCLTFSAAAVLIAEVLLFNGKSLTAEFSDKVITAQSFSCEGDTILDGDHIFIKGGCTLTLDDVPENTRTVICSMYQKRTPESRRFRVSLGLKDDNFAYSYQTVQEKYTMGYDHDCAFSYEPYGRTRSLRFTFSEVAEPVTFYSVRLLSAVPFKFSLPRFSVLLGILAVISAVKTFSLHKICFDPRKIAHRILVYGMAAVCAASLLPLSAC